MVCPVCQSAAGGTIEVWRTSQAATGFTCEVCGEFKVSSAALAMIGTENTNLTTVKRAALTHRLRRSTDTGGETQMVMSDWLEGDGLARLTLPSAAQQATNIIRLIGRVTSESGQEMRTVPLSFHASIGSASRDFAMAILFELRDRGVLKLIDTTSLSRKNAQNVSLTLSGWELYESEKTGKTSGSYGFLALKFGDEILDPFVQLHIKPAVAELGFELRDMRDGARAGVIDNLMRIDIRDAAFVIADLTHDNAGSYWEAGYAEGLGKPVLYICEKSKFGSVKTHFDTNHSTTVQWDVDDPEAFKRDLIATLRRSLVL